MIAISFFTYSPIFSVLAQMDFGPTIDLLCPLVGLSLLVGFIISLAVHLRSPKTKPRLFPGAVILFGLLFLGWIPFQIENYFFEPHWDDTSASGLVYDLPEVQHYMKMGESAGTPKAIEYIETNGARPGLPFHSAQYAVGDARDGNPFQVSNTWHIFGVNLISGHVSIWANDSGKWVPIEQWRQKKERN